MFVQSPPHNIPWYLLRQTPSFQIDSEEISIWIVVHVLINMTPDPLNY